LETSLIFHGRLRNAQAGRDEISARRRRTKAMQARIRRPYALYREVLWRWQFPDLNEPDMR
jgi:hypothetical protein